jgi:hypothetical protein
MPVHTGRVRQYNNRVLLQKKIDNTVVPSSKSMTAAISDLKVMRPVDAPSLVNARERVRGLQPYLVRVCTRTWHSACKHISFRTR